MIFSEVAGVMLTADPTTGALDRMIIESVFGQGEAIVSGRVEPDTYILDKAGPRVLSVHQGRQKFKIVRGPDGADIEQPLDEGEVDRRTLSQAEIIAIAELGLRAERHYGNPQDLEWARADGDTYLVQSRPITTLGAPPASESRPATSATPTLLLSGLAASVGRASGRVRILTSPHQQADFLDGEVLVAEMTSPDWVPAMRRAAALITDGGGVTCHAAIVSRELQLPCVVGTGNATASLRTGQEVTVDGRTGKVYAGTGPTVTVQRPAQPLPEPVSPLATRLYVNLAVAEHADEVAALPVDGVGPASSRIHGGRCLERCPPAPADRTWSARSLRRRDVHVVAADHSCLRAPTRRLPQHRLPDQRIPRPGGRGGLRTARGEPDDRLSRVLPLHPPARSVQP